MPSIFYQRAKTGSRAYRQQADDHQFNDRIYRDIFVNKNNFKPRKNDMLKTFRDTAKSSLLNVIVYHFKFVDAIIIKSSIKNK